MKEATIIHHSTEWTLKERILFRLLFIYFMLQALPLDWKYYKNIAAIKWSAFQFRNLFYLARYTPQFYSGNNTLTLGISTLSDWAIIFMISIIGTITWSIYSRRKEYNDLYYVLRVVIRYRLAIGVIAYGFIKFFPMQLPYPSLSLENTNYGDFSDWKIAYMSYGVAPSFESYLGVIEIFGGLLLFNRKTASIGAAFVVGSVGNVFLSNLGYNGGETLYCLYLLLMATVIIFYDVSRWHTVIMLGKTGMPNSYHPSFYTGWRKRGRELVKISFIVFLFAAYGYNSYSLYRDDGYQYPKTVGLTNVMGLYNVREFRINDKKLPYSLTDSLRWQNVVFENWATISILSNRRASPVLRNTEEIFIKNEDRDYESSGSTGRFFYQYEVDTLHGLLHLQNKNKNYPGDELLLHYERPNDHDIILYGLNENKDSIYVSLEKIAKTYLLDESYKIPRKRSIFYKP